MVPGMRVPISLFYLLIPAILVQAKPERRPTYEPVTAPAAGAGVNLFLKAKTRASGHWDKQSADLAVDGKVETASHWACENLPVWHQVDLGEPKVLSALRVWPYWDGSRVYQYKVEGSKDGTSWELLADHSANSIAATSEGDAFRFEPRPVRFVRTTITGNTAGAKTGGHLVEIQGYAEAAAPGLSGGIGSLDLRYPPAGKPELAPAEAGLRLSAWRGERVNAQVVVTSAENHESLRIESPPLTGPGRIETNARFIRYTLANGKPEGDILDTAETIAHTAGTNRPIWFSVDVPAEAAPGQYRGSLIVRTDSARLEFPVVLDVLPALLPPPRDWKFHLDLWQHPEAVARWHDVPSWSPEHFDLMEPMMRRLAAAGQKTITTTIVHEAWNGQTYDAFPSMVRWIKQRDGNWRFDYSRFDALVEFMDKRAGLDGARIHCYTMIPWSLKFRYFDEAKSAYVDAALRPGTPEYDEYWGRFLRDFSAHLQGKGWLERTLIGIDERPDALMRGAMATLAKHAPGIGIASAINAPSELTREFADISPIIQHADGVIPLAAERRAAGKMTTFYTCTSPPVPNTFTFSPPAESEWLGLFAAAAGLDGYLRWAYNSWVENPLVSTDFTSWPSGDCFLVYPGNRSSIRFERLRDGIEGWEKIRLLREWGKQSPTAAAKTALAELDAALAPLTWDRGRHPGGHAADVLMVNAAIDKASRMVSPPAGTIGSKKDQ